MDGNKRGKEYDADYQERCDQPSERPQYNLKNQANSTQPYKRMIVITIILVND